LHLHEDKKSKHKAVKAIYHNTGAISIMRNPAQYFSGRTVVSRPTKQAAPVQKKHIQTYKSAHKSSSSGRLGKAGSVQLSKQNSAMLQLLQPNVLCSAKAAELRAKIAHRQDHVKPIEDGLMISHQHKNIAAAVEDEKHPAETPQQSQATAKPVLVQTGSDSDGCDLKPATSDMPVQAERTVADSAEVSQCSAGQQQALPGDQDLASSKLPAGSKQDQGHKSSSTAVAAAGKRNWCRNSRLTQAND
jgi:hypothetical protein